MENQDKKTNKVLSFFKNLPSNLKKYFQDYYKRMNWPLYIGLICLSIALFLLDFFSKRAAYEHFQGNRNVTESFIPGLINITLVFNNGAAWNSFSGQMWLLCTISMIASIALFINLVFRFLSYNKLMMVGISLMLPGALGNLIDRIGYATQSGIYKNGVIDFLQFAFWTDFPVCNIADYCLTIGIVILLIGFVIEFKTEYAKLKAEEEEEKKTVVPTVTEDSKEKDKLEQVQLFNEDNDNE